MKKLKLFKIHFISGTEEKRFVFIKAYDIKNALDQFWNMYTSVNTQLFKCEEVS